MISVEQYALDHNRLHPKVVEFLQPYFIKENALDLSTVRIRVYPRRTSALGTSVWVMLDTIIFRRGTFNKERGVVPQAVDLTTNWGMTVLAHELRHVKQWRDVPKWTYAWSLIIGVLASWKRRKRAYAHPFIPIEIEAADFQDSIRPVIREREADGELEIFRQLR